jgi:hypothetical protein
MILSLDFFQFTIHNRDSGKSTTQKHDPDADFIEGKNATEILILVSIIEKHDSG